jgi:hypothetical protein
MEGARGVAREFDFDLTGFTRQNLPVLQDGGGTVTTGGSAIDDEGLIPGIFDRE